MDIFEKCWKFTQAAEARASGYYPYFTPIESQQDTEVIIDGRRVIMIGSNNYLGLTTHPKVKEAAAQALKKFGTSCTGSRFLNGTIELHVELEERLAKFTGKEAALVFSTGFQANLGTISALVGRHDTVIIDYDDHASIVDGCQLSHGKTIRFRHNDMAGLRRALQKAEHRTGKLVVVDGVFSMEGDIAPLPEIIPLCKQFGARLMVDDAHAVGVIGVNGSGTASHFGVTDEVDIIMGTFSKSFASLGGFIAAKAEVIDYVKHISRALIFSASMTPASVAACLASLDIMEKEPERRERLWQITHRMHREYRAMGFDIGNTQTPIVPIIVGDDLKTFMFWKGLLDEGVFVNPVRSPAVPVGRALLRTSYMATHTDEQLDRVLEAFQKVGKALGVIS
ncbi:MAG: aminotransferase class I/II-fold pyridoxal phosphate-dependent enzyme [Thermodesulfobacteriota bacterium]